MALPLDGLDKYLLGKVKWLLGLQKQVRSVRALQDKNQKLFDLVVILYKPSTNPKISGSR